MLLIAAGLAVLLLALVYLLGKSHGGGPTVAHEDPRHRELEPPSESVRPVPLPAVRRPDPPIAVKNAYQPPPERPINLADLRQITPNLHDVTGLRLIGVLDAETTGFANSDEIIQFAIALVGFHPDTLMIAGVADFYVGLRQPSVPINPYASAVNGFIDSDLKGHSLDSEKICQIIARSEFLVAHNAIFDRRFVRLSFPRAEERPWKCTMRSIDWGGFESKRLEELTIAHGLDASDAHGATSDVASLIELLCYSDCKYFLQLMKYPDEFLKETRAPSRIKKQRKAKAAGSH